MNFLSLGFWQKCNIKMENKEKAYLQRLIFKFEKELRELPSYSIYSQVVEAVLNDIPMLSDDEIDDEAYKMLKELPDLDNPLIVWIRQILEQYIEMRKRGKANLN